MMLLPGDAEALPWEQHAVKAAGTRAHSDQPRTAIGRDRIRLRVTADSESKGLCWSQMLSSTGRKHLRR